jgi:hypothetical protein
MALRYPTSSCWQHCGWPPPPCRHDRKSRQTTD